jgi:hypothetical protein
MFHANNTFMFQTRDHTKEYGIMENLANWLYELQDKRRKAMGRIVVWRWVWWWSGGLELAPATATWPASEGGQGVDWRRDHYKWLGLCHSFWWFFAVRWGEALMDKMYPQTIAQPRIHHSRC